MVIPNGSRVKKIVEVENYAIQDKTYHQQTVRSAIYVQRHYDQVSAAQDH